MPIPYRLHDPRQNRDVEVTVSFAVDGRVTLEQAQKWAADAISAALDFEAEKAQWGERDLPLFQYNGETALEAHWA